MTYEHLNYASIFVCIDDRYWFIDTYINCFFFFIFTRGKKLICIVNVMNGEYATKFMFICIRGAVWHFEMKHKLIGLCNQFLHYPTSNHTSHLGWFHCFRVEFASLIRNWTKKEKKWFERWLRDFQYNAFNWMLTPIWFLKNLTTTTSSASFFFKWIYWRKNSITWWYWLANTRQDIFDKWFSFCSHSISNIWLLSCQFLVHHILKRIRTLLGANTPKRLDYAPADIFFAVAVIFVFFFMVCQYDFGEASETNELVHSGWLLIYIKPVQILLITQSSSNLHKYCGIYRSLL